MEQKYSNKSAKFWLKDTIANMEIEGLSPTEYEKEQCYKVLLGEKTGDEIIQEDIKNYMEGQ